MIFEPVIDRVRRVLGMVTLLDIIRHAELVNDDRFIFKLQQLLPSVTRARQSHAEKPEVIGQIMTGTVHTAKDTMHIVELMPLLAEYELHHIPIVNADLYLVGIVSNADLVAGLYRGRLADGVGAA